jgi:hypothetical protein
MIYWKWSRFIWAYGRYFKMRLLNHYQVGINYDRYRRFEFNGNLFSQSNRLGAVRFLQHLRFMRTYLKQLGLFLID